MINLFLDDGSHQSEKGAFLVVCTMVKVLTNELPGLEFLIQSDQNISIAELSLFLDAIEAAISR